VQHLEEAVTLGMQPQQAQTYALRMVWAGRQQSQGAADSDAQRKVDFLQKQAGFTPNRGASMNPSKDAKGKAPPQDSTLSLADLMRKNLEAAGITDDDIARTH
jgi:hypothetical protein